MLYDDMSKLMLLLCFALLHTAVITAKTHDKTNGPNCQNFSQGVTFNESEAIGTWHLLHFITEKEKGSGDPHCVEFIPVDEQERNKLQDRIGKYVENLNWDTISLKMEIPCKSLNSNKTRDYYLERLENNGSYRTLQMPPASAKLDLAEFHRYPMRLKIIEGQYLGMIDCHEKFVFLLGKQPPEGKKLDEKVKKMIETYWPEE
ncbi:unnamed protein product [Danaus chrysippus]|uniref:(African queen) hypothetical protein n=1 Tax=Danaus chrysippus TaxID=151541 RepID=A0A8J2W7Z3_9NEOP|nr:unnamed protein product [Danaus chrysippus]